MTTTPIPGIRLLAVVLAALGIVSCTVGPDYVRPAADVPAAYRYANGDGGAPPPPALQRGRWWEIYGDAELDALESQVVLSNQSVLAAEARVRQAQALVNVARAPSFITLNVGTTNDNAVATLGWEIDLWGRIRRSVEASAATAEASADDLAAATLSLQAQVAQNYFLLRMQDAQIRLLENSVAQYARSLQLTRNQYAVRVASRGAVVQAEAQLNSTRAQAFDAQVGRAQLENSIAILIGKAPADLRIAAQDTLPQIPALPSSLPSQLLVRRPDIASVERRMAAANAQVGVAAAAYYPSIRLFAGDGVDIAFAGGVALAQYILDGGLRDAQSAQTAAAYDETVANYRQTVLSALRDVEDNLVALRILEQEADAQSVAVKAARESVTITNNQYGAGIVNYLSVVVVQAAALINERAEIDILGRRLVANVNLIKALGGGWEAEAPTSEGP